MMAYGLAEGMAGTTGLEPATSDVTGRRSNQLSYVPAPLTSLEYHRHAHRHNKASQQVVAAQNIQMVQFMPRHDVGGGTSTQPIAAGHTAA